MTNPADRDPVLMAVADGLMDEQMLSVVPDTRGQHHVVDYLPLRDAIYAALLSERHRAEEAKWLPMAVEIDRRGAVIERLEAEIARLLSPPEGVEGLIMALESGTQADQDGVMVIVSRQACHEAVRLLKGLLPVPLQPLCQHCNDTGFVAINAFTGIYIRPGPVPDDARGVAEAPCWECNIYPGGFDGPTGAD